MAAGETAGPSTSLRSGRDDNSVAGSTTVPSHLFRSLQNCHPDRRSGWCVTCAGPHTTRRALRLSPRDPFSAVYYGIAAYAYFVGRNYDEAIRLSREGIRQRSDFVGAHRVLTAAAGMAGQADIARAALLELRRAQPNISLAWISSQMPIKLEADRKHYSEGFHRAGLE